MLRERHVRHASFSSKLKCVDRCRVIVQVETVHHLVIPSREEVCIVFAPRERKDVGRVTQEPSARAIRTCLWRAGSRVVIVVQIADVNAHVVAATRHPLP